MENAIHQETRNGLTIKIIPESDPIRPDEIGDDSLFLVAGHRQFFVAGPKDYSPEKYTSTHWRFNLEAYIHSGVVLALSNEGQFPDRSWDVSQLGVVFVSREYWRTANEAREAALSLIESWNDYLSGNVYGYQVLDAGAVIESCWGYPGDYDQKDGVLDEARAIVDIMTNKGKTDASGQFLFAFAQ